MSTSYPHRDTSRSQTVRLRAFLPEAVFVGVEDIEVRRCKNRAELCQPGDVFIPQNTPASDEHDKVEEAIRRGAVAVVAERLLPVSVPQCLVENTHEAFGQVCQALVGNPSHHMLTIGIIGTYGKTTTALFVAAMLKRLSGSVAYYTSLGASDSTSCDRTATRPPAARKLANWLDSANQAGSAAAIVELTPAMLHHRAAAGIGFDLIIVTGMRPGQFRGSPSAGEFAKLLDLATENLKSHGMVLFNADDSHASAWAENSGVTTVSYGLDAAEHIRGKRLARYGAENQILAIAGNMIMPLTLKMPGDHVARAALAAVATSWLMELSVPEAIAGIESLEGIPGRMQRLSQAVEVPLYIDSGETPDRVAVALHSLKQHQLGPATVVMDISASLKSACRQRLGEVLDKGAQRVVLSAADLSPEAAQRVAMDVLGGFRAPGRVEVIPDRAAAIRWAVENTEHGCILLSGCGVSGWIDRSGDELTDERVAKLAVSKRNVLPPLPKLSIFPPPSSNQHFAH